MGRGSETPDVCVCVCVCGLVGGLSRVSPKLRAVLRAEHALVLKLLVLLGGVLKIRRNLASANWLSPKVTILLRFGGSSQLLSTWSETLQSPKGETSPASQTHLTCKARARPASLEPASKLNLVKT